MYFNWDFRIFYEEIFYGKDVGFVVVPYTRDRLQGWWKDPHDGAGGHGISLVIQLNGFEHNQVRWLVK